MKRLMSSEKPHYSPEFFNSGYYGQGERSGFTHYEYGSPEQEEQLALKKQFCEFVPHNSALFVGCALGFEVAYWYRNGHEGVYGVDVSRWAINNQIIEAQGRCLHYDGAKLPFLLNESFDLVAAFDVLTLVPEDMFQRLAAEIVRVAKAGIVFRVVVKDWTNLDSPCDGEDGSTFKLRHFWEYDKAFSQSGRFKLDWMKQHGNHEVTAIYQRVQP